MSARGLLWAAGLLTVVAQAEFVRTAYLEGADKQVSWILPRADRAGARYQVVERTFARRLKPTLAHDLEVRFEGLTRSQLAALNREYRGHATWRENETYRLADFLAPAIQALAGHRLLGQGPPLLLSNCWNLSYETARGWRPSFTVFYVDEAVTRPLLEDDRYSEIVSRRELRTGDVLLYFQLNEEEKPARRLVHSAIFIDDDLYFEKTGPDEWDTYRFVRFGDLQQVFAGGEEEEFIFRRFAKAPLPSPVEAFVDPRRPDLTPMRDGGPGFARLKDVPLVKEPETGRYRLPEGAYRKAYFGFGV